MNIVDQVILISLMLTTAVCAVALFRMRSVRLWKQMDHIDLYRHGGAIGFFAAVSVSCLMAWLGVGIGWRTPLPLFFALFFARGLLGDLTRGKRLR